MTITQARLVAAPATRLKQARAALIVAAIVAVATGLLELLAPPSTGDKLITTADYVFTCMLFPLVLAPLAALTLLRQIHGGGGRLGTTGYWIAWAGFLGFVPCGIASLMSGNSEALGPLYLLSMLASLAGLIVFAVAAFRARVLPRWAGPLLPAGWLLGGPVTAGLPGTTFIMAVAFTVIAMTLPSGPATGR